MDGLEDYEGLTPVNSLEGLRKEGLSDGQKAYLQEVIPEPEDWLHMNHEEKLDSINMMELRRDEMEIPTELMPRTISTSCCQSL